MQARPPVGIGEGLDQSQLLVADRLVALLELGQQDSAAGEPGFEGMEGGRGFTRFGGGPRDKAPLMRLAASWAAEAMGVSWREMAQGGWQRKPPVAKTAGATRSACSTP